MIDTVRTGTSGRSSSVARGLSEQEFRIYDTIPAQVDYVRHHSFCRKNTERKLFGADAPGIDVPGYTLMPVLQDGSTVAAGPRRVLSTDDERTLFLRYNYARYRVAKLQKPQLKRFSIARARAMAAWQMRALELRAAIARANLPLVHSMAKRSRITSVEFVELISEGNLAVLRCIDKFDVSRGFKFSTYACRAIIKSFHRFAAKAGRYQKAFGVEYAPELERADYSELRHQQRRMDSIEMVRELLKANHAGLSEMERTVLLHRFPVFSDDEPKTLAEIGRRVRMTNEGVRQIQKRALGKLLTVVEAQIAG